MSNKLSEIRKLRESRTLKSPDTTQILKQRLVKLVTKYGVDYVSEASGLRVTTIHQYMRVKNPDINSGRLNMAREILEEVFKN